MYLDNSKRWKNFAAMALIGDGIMTLVRPQREVRGWSAGPKPWQSIKNLVHGRPGLTRLLGVAQIVGGVCWILHHKEKAKTPVTLEG